MERVVQELQILLLRRKIPPDGIEIEVIAPSREIADRIDAATIASLSQDDVLIRDTNNSDHTVILGTPVTITAASDRHRRRTNGWQSLETAPSDGTQFLACVVSGERSFVIHGWIEDGRFRSASTELDAAALATHWMPLPPRP